LNVYVSEVYYPKFFKQSYEFISWLPMGYSETVLHPSQITELYATIEEGRIRTKWGMAEFGKLYRQGFKQCTTCQIMIRFKDRDEYRCPVCGRIMRNRVKRRK
jgi:predicted RNA-binding Zn-ribbon protein involved in translation (DUF1610 family)